MNRFSQFHQLPPGQKVRGVDVTFPHVTRAPAHWLPAVTRVSGPSAPASTLTRAQWDREPPAPATIPEWANVRSDVVVWTALATSMTPLRENVQPHAIIVDEVARFAERDLWSVLAWYNPQALLLLGDHHQLRPLIFTALNENPCSPQLQVPLFTRLYYNGLMEHMFREQHRMVPQFCGVVSENFYHLELRTASVANPEVVEVNTQFWEFNKQRATFRLKSPLVCVDVADGEDTLDQREVSDQHLERCDCLCSLEKSPIK
ncbi:hypothetical protein BJX64DRAFT_73046 [Aspergillus heterothallicus]